MSKKQVNIKTNMIIIFMMIGLIGSIGYNIRNNQQFQNKLSNMEYENDELSDKVERLENEKKDLVSQIENEKTDKEFYQKKVLSNQISIESDIEYGLLKKYDLTYLIVDDEDYKTFKLGQLRVKYKVNGYKEYSELLQAKQKDYFMKYVMLLNAAYDGRGMDHFYEYYPY